MEGEAVSFGVSGLPTRRCVCTFCTSKAPHRMTLPLLVVFVSETPGRAMWGWLTAITKDEHEFVVHIPMLLSHQRRFKLRSCRGRQGVEDMARELFPSVAFVLKQAFVRDTNDHLETLERLLATLPRQQVSAVALCVRSPQCTALYSSLETLPLPPQLAPPPPPPSRRNPNGRVPRPDASRPRAPPASSDPTIRSAPCASTRRTAKNTRVNPPQTLCMATVRHALPSASGSGDEAACSSPKRRRSHATEYRVGDTRPVPPSPGSSASSSSAPSPEGHGGAVPPPKCPFKVLQGQVLSEARPYDAYATLLRHGRVDEIKRLIDVAGPRWNSYLIEEIMVNGGRPPFHKFVDIYYTGIFWDAECAFVLPDGSTIGGVRLPVASVVNWYPFLKEVLAQRRRDKRQAKRAKQTS